MLDHDKNVYTSLATFSLTSAGGSAVDPTDIGADNETAAVSNLTAEQLPSFFSSTAKIVVSKGEKELFYDVKIDKTLPGASGTTAIAYVDATAVANYIPPNLNPGTTAVTVAYVTPGVTGNVVYYTRYDLIGAFYLQVSLNSNLVDIIKPCVESNKKISVIGGNGFFTINGYFTYLMYGISSLPYPILINIPYLITTAATAFNESNLIPLVLTSTLLDPYSPSLNNSLIAPFLPYGITDYSISNFFFVSNTITSISVSYNYTATASDVCHPPFKYLLRPTDVVQGTEFGIYTTLPVDEFKEGNFDLSITSTTTGENYLFCKKDLQFKCAKLLGQPGIKSLISFPYWIPALQPDTYFTSILWRGQAYDLGNFTISQQAVLN